MLYLFTKEIWICNLMLSRRFGRGLHHRSPDEGLGRNVARALNYRFIINFLFPLELYGQDKENLIWLIDSVRTT